MIDTNGKAMDDAAKIVPELQVVDDGGEWQYPTNSFRRFFKVSVEIP